MAASTIASMWDLLQAGTAELLVTDIGFPDGDALELLPRIQDKYPDMTIIMMSARANLLTAIKTQQNEVFDYLPKPFELKALLATVERPYGGWAARDTVANCGHAILYLTLFDG